MTVPETWNNADRETRIRILRAAGWLEPFTEYALTSTYAQFGSMQLSIVLGINGTKDEG